MATGARERAPASTGHSTLCGCEVGNGGWFCLFSGRQGQTGSLEFKTTVANVLVRKMGQASMADLGRR